MRPRGEWPALVEKQGPCTHLDCTVKDCQRVLKDYLRSLALKQNAMRAKK